MGLEFRVKVKIRGRGNVSVPRIPNTRYRKAMLRGLHYIGRGHDIQFTWGGGGGGEGRIRGKEQSKVSVWVDTSTVLTDWVWAPPHIAITDSVWVPLPRLDLHRVVRIGCQELSTPTTSICMRNTELYAKSQTHHACRSGDKYSTDQVTQEHYEISPCGC